MDGTDPKVVLYSVDPLQFCATWPVFVRAEPQRHWGLVEKNPRILWVVLDAASLVVKVAEPEKSKNVSADVEGADALIALLDLPSTYLQDYLRTLQSVVTMLTM